MIDDGLTDLSGEICDKYALKDSQIQVIHLEKNSGVSHARNEGLRLSEGNLITFIDSDDYVNSAMLERLYANMLETGASVAVCGLVRIGTGKYIHMVESGPACILSSREAIHCTFHHSIFNLSIGGKIYKKEAIGEILFDENMIYGEDSLFLYQVLKNAEKISYVPDKLYYNVIRKESATQENSNARRYAAVDFYDRVFDSIKLNFPETFPVF